jgi:hypothetical protein
VLRLSYSGTENKAMNYLPMTFGRGPPITLGCANGVPVRYEVRHVARGCWDCVADAGAKRYGSPHFKTERDAKAWARADFRRRQLIRLAA